QHGRWHVAYTDRGYPPSSAVSMFQTTDNGESFALSCFSPRYPERFVAGMGLPGELRQGWGHNDGEAYLGYESIDTDCHYKYVDWIDSLLPGRPDTLNSSHNYFGLPSWRILYYDFVFFS